MRHENCQVCQGPLPEARHTTCGARCRDIWETAERARVRWRNDVHAQLDALIAGHRKRQITVRITTG